MANLDLVDRYVNGILYKGSRTESTALHAISNCYSLGDYTWGLEYYRPSGMGKDVVVYVMEEDYSYEDFPMDDPDWRLYKAAGTGTANRLKFLSDKAAKGQVDKKRAQLDPILRPGSHGAQMISLLGGATFGAAQCCKVVIVNKPNEENDKGYTWEIALDVVAQHFTTKKKGRPLLHGVMNISRGFQNNGKCRRAMNHIVSAGIVVVGAAGNQSIDFDQRSATNRDQWQLPEGFDRRVIIIGSLDDCGSISRFSNYGNRVDYWVQGEKLAYAGYEGHGRANGTSHATAIASGVIACMLEAGQVDYANDATMKDKPIHERVRARLDEWAAVDAQGLKHLKNAAGLTLNSPPGHHVSTPQPQLIRLTIDDQIANARAELTQKQQSESHEECEVLKKKLRILNRQRASGSGLDEVIEVAPSQPYTILPTPRHQQRN